MSTATSASSMPRPGANAANAWKNSAARRERISPRTGVPRRFQIWRALRVLTASEQAASPPTISRTSGVNGFRITPVGSLERHPNAQVRECRVLAAKVDLSDGFGVRGRPKDVKRAPKTVLFRICHTFLTYIERKPFISVGKSGPRFRPFMRSPLGQPSKTHLPRF
jgi:hypothetical protein